MEKLLDKHGIEKEFHQILKDFKCLKCGFCCTHFTLRVNPNSPQNQNMKRAILDGIKDSLGIEMEEPLGPTVIQQYGICKQLDTKTKRCKIYDNRPRICKTFFCLRDLLPHTFLQIAKVAFENSGGDEGKFTALINRLITYSQSRVMVGQEEEIARQKAIEKKG